MVQQLSHAEKITLIDLLKRTPYPVKPDARTSLCSKIDVDHKNLPMDGSADDFSTNLIQRLIDQDNQEGLCRLCEVLEEEKFGSNQKKQLEEIKRQLNCPKKKSKTNYFPVNNASPPTLNKLLVIGGVGGVVLLFIFGGIGKDINTTPTPAPSNYPLLKSDDCNERLDRNNPDRIYFGHTKGVNTDAATSWCSQEYNVRCRKVAPSEPPDRKFGVAEGQCYYTK
ncbi:hypothetical protein QUA03_10070 [Microcoleus sp. S36b_A4]|uniref:hypothetical protein n=1 Tax=Microcoleus sp. S36b_A4 TaxID=3055420 RepID=UPI002FCF828B